MYDLIIIGAGPGGYVSAIRAGQVGLKTAIIDREFVGGMCLNWGCIPSKAFLESAKLFQKIQDSSEFGIDGIEKSKISFNWQNASKRANKIVRKLTKGVEFLLKKNGVEIIKGEAKIISKNEIEVENRILETKNIIIATGSTFPKLEIPAPQISIKELWKIENLPENIAVYGSGPVSFELAQMLSLSGKNITLIKDNQRLIPLVDNYLESYSERILKKQKISLLNGNEIRFNEKSISFKDKEIEIDLVINAQARKPIVPPISISFEQENDFIKTNEFMQTSISNIYAVGDVNGKSIFAHAASAQGLIAVNHIKGINESYSDEKIPINIYSVPEMAQIGLTEEQVKNDQIDYKINEFSLSANGKALTEGNSEGIIRLISEKKYGEILGVQIISDNATDLISEASAIMQIEGTIFDLAKTIHAHPTVSEIFMEAGLDATGAPVHK